MIIRAISLLETVNDHEEEHCEINLQLVITCIYKKFWYANENYSQLKVKLCNPSYIRM